MTSVLRMIDTGLRPSRWNVAMTAALAELHGAGRIPNTLRFHRYPESVLIGRHQFLADAVDPENCLASGIEIARRMSGGGAVYMAPGALAWDIAFSRSDIHARRDAANAAICEAIAAGLARLGLRARYRPQNEIEVAGRKICGSSGYFEGGTMLHQGTILLDAGTGRMADVLRLPSDESRHRQRHLAQRLTSVAELLGRTPDPDEIKYAISAAFADAFGFALRPDTPQEQETFLAGELFSREFALDSFVFDSVAPGGIQTLVGRDGTVNAYIRLYAGDERLIEQIWLTGNFDVSPARVITDLEAALRGLPVRDAAARALAALSSGSVEMRGATRDSVAAAIADAVEKTGLQQRARLS